MNNFVILCYLLSYRSYIACTYVLDLYNLYTFVQTLVTSVTKPGSSVAMEPRMRAGMPRNRGLNLDKNAGFISCSTYPDCPWGPPSLLFSVSIGVKRLGPSAE